MFNDQQQIKLLIHDIGPFPWCKHSLQWSFLSYWDATSVGKRCAQPVGPREPVSSRFLDPEGLGGAGEVGRESRFMWIVDFWVHFLPFLLLNKMAMLLKRKLIQPCSARQEVYVCVWGGSLTPSHSQPHTWFWLAHSQVMSPGHSRKGNQFWVWVNTSLAV